MNVGKLVGYVILSFVDALLPPVFAIAIVFVSSLLVGLLSVRRGGKPFPLTRSSRRLFEWVVRWIWI